MEYNLIDSWEKDKNYLANDKCYFMNMVFVCLLPNKNSPPYLGTDTKIITEFTSIGLVVDNKNWRYI